MEATLARADIEERNFLEQVFLSKRFDLLETRVDYLRRESARDVEFAHEIYLQLLLKDPKRLARFVCSGCELKNPLMLDIAVKKKVYISKSNTRLASSHIHHYYVTILKTDTLELFQQVEEELKEALHEKTIIMYVIEAKAMKIIHYLCEHGMCESIVNDCIVLHKNLSERDNSDVLTAIASRHNCVEFLTAGFMVYAPLVHHWHKCELLLQLGAKFSAEQREELARTAPEAYQKFFVEDV